MSSVPSRRPADRFEAHAAPARDGARTTVIVGGVAGGMSAATRLRRLDEQREIIVLERSSEVSFANCGLPYHVSGVIADRDALSLQSPERLAARFRIDARVRHEAVAIDRAAKTVTVRRLDDDTTSVIAYDELVLSPGAAPRRPAGIATGAPVHALRTLDDLDRLMARLDRVPADGAVVVIGGGYIGVEMADNLHRRDLGVTLVQRGTHLLASLDEEMAAPVADHLAGLGIDVRLGRHATSIGVDHVVLDDGSRIAADLVVAAIGVTPESSLAAAAGLAIGASGGIAVDTFHRTSDASIFAIGDAAEKRDAIDGEGRLTTLAGLANRHGRAVADTIAGDAAPSRPALGTAIVDAAGLTAASVGWTERVARERGRDVRVVHTHPASHAGYYPGACPLSMKLVVDAVDDRILGAQAVGTDGVDKRIDVIATAMSAGLAASALADLELAYAPQYGSAKDPINMLGYVARNLASGEDRVIQWHELDDELAAGAVLLDVRAEAQLAEGLIPGALWVPVESLRERHAEFAGRRVVVHCRVGQGAHTAARLLAELGHDVVNLDGGYLTWRDGQRARSLAELPLAA
ncbi:NADPH-dependent 2,4-dienoyl-CoA reductase/sulfur reductase-like enzyme/rhodanese-related sulfurtransferase [Agromyces hippuratus]|uniref:NADPH-dependent 2,4-dienoyl-CoA reductase/sulfur reductase-like enzyme/rhodanese-related sulfurtransferase n=1 Tax=Agromyces hippuratus TaxID=286438 RepID=A0A852WWB9_9MICO|nr:NADPH-dependent 2,4-dienoyl-CoA reductase/sulfur reductase-like enzyme/rhodanese-related sulfurtransferase [Agromyces hippuratus]